VSSGTGHVENARIGVAVAIVLWPGVISYVVWPTRKTLVLSIVGTIIWVLSGVFFRHIADW